MLLRAVNIIHISVSEQRLARHSEIGYRYPEYVLLRTDDLIVNIMILPVFPRHHLIDIKKMEVRIISFFHKKRIRIVQHEIHISAREILPAPFIDLQVLHIILKHDDVILCVLKPVLMPLCISRITVSEMIRYGSSHVFIIGINRRRILKTV